jgi:acetyl-CoA acetyltransferase
MAYRAEIPYGAYWSTPFAKWQGAFANLHAIEFAAHVAKAELAKRRIAPEVFDFGVLGMTVPQKSSFYGLPWFMGLLGSGGRKVGGPTINQACATSVRCLLAGAQEIESGLASTALIATCDRISNGPHIVYPNPAAPGGTAAHENWVLDNFSNDPLGGHAMVQTAENVARKYQVTTAQQHEVVLRRVEQYAAARADDQAFQKRYMSLPFDVPAPNFKKNAGTLDGDEGVMMSTAEGLARLKPVLPDGTVTYGGQTHPADGSAAVVVATPEKCRDMSSEAGIRIGILGFGLARAELAHMPEATIPAAKQALDQAALAIRDMDAVKSHNPFAVNDIVFARTTGADLMAMNNYGCSLIWGHPQGPTGLRSIIELIEELVIRGGGRGLFTGCAAGDTAMAVVIDVDTRKH